MSLLKEPTLKWTWGDRSFSVAALRLWNHLPTKLKSCHSITRFKSLLKTHSKKFSKMMYMYICNWIVHVSHCIVHVILSGATRVQFSGGTRGCTTFSRGHVNCVYPAGPNGDLFFQNSEWGGGGHPGGGTDLGLGGTCPPPHSYATGYHCKLFVFIFFTLCPCLEHPAGWICARYKSSVLLLLLCPIGFVHVPLVLYTKPKWRSQPTTQDRVLSFS